MSLTKKIQSISTVSKSLSIISPTNTVWYDSTGFNFSVEYVKKIFGRKNGVTALLATDPNTGNLNVIIVNRTGYTLIVMPIYNNTFNSGITLQNVNQLPSWEADEFVSQWSVTHAYLMSCVNSPVVSSSPTLISYTVASLPQINAGTQTFNGSVVGAYGRIFPIPNNVAVNSSLWYLDSNFVLYSFANTSGATYPATSFYTGVYAPNGRVYTMPGPASTTTWMYIDSKQTPPVAYSYNVSTALNGNSVNGGVFAPNGNIYLIPRTSMSTVWYYLNTNTEPPTIETYSQNSGVPILPNNAFCGGVLTPDCRIYLSPYLNLPGTLINTTWFYIDTIGNNVVSFPQNSGYTTPGTFEYQGACYAPNGRIFFSPNQGSNSPVWLYINTTTRPPTVVSYFQNSGFSFPPANAGGAFIGGCVCGPDGNIYMSPHHASENTTWVYIDAMSTPPNVYSYARNAPSMQQYAFYGISNTPSGDIFLAPQNQSIVTTWYRIRPKRTKKFELGWCNGPISNKY